MRLRRLRIGLAHLLGRWAAGEQCPSEWLRTDHLEIYVRVGPWLQQGYDSSDAPPHVQIANIVVRRGGPGQGLLHRAGTIVRSLTQAAIVIECVMNPELAEALHRRGFERLASGDAGSYPDFLLAEGMPWPAPRSGLPPAGATSEWDTRRHAPCGNPDGATPA